MTHDKADLAANLTVEIDTAERKAWESLARYKFVMFGYWAGLWVHLNRAGGFKRPSPFRTLVAAARQQRERAAADSGDLEAAA